MAFLFFSRKRVINILETIKSYLVSLGFAVDNKTYGEATKAIDKVGEGVAKFAGSATTKFALAGLAVTSFVATAVIGIAKFVSGLGEAQIEIEKTARQMWISEDSAMAFNSTLKALHANLQDLYLSPTLAGQFQELMKEANSLRPPDEFKSQMKLVQSITFEFKRMKLEATYALQWIGYYFIKYMQGPIFKIKLTLKDINDIIIRTMPHWTKVVAEVMSWFARMGIATVRAIKDVIRVFDDIGKAIPKNVKLIGGALAALALIIETGPIGIIMTILVAAILLLDDFYTYLDGGDSAFGPFWKKLEGIYKKLKESGGFIDNLKRNFKEAFNAVSHAIDWAYSKLTKFLDALSNNGTLDSFSQTWSNIYDIISSLSNTGWGWIEEMFKALQDQKSLTDFLKNIEDLVAAVGELSKAVTGAVNKFLELKGTKTVLKDIGDFLSNVVVKSFDEINRKLKTMTEAIIAMAKLFKGDWSGALGAAQKALNDFLQINPSGKASGVSYIYPNNNTQNNHNSKVTLQQTNNIYGSDPKATAGAAQDNFASMTLRNFRGVFA